METLASVFILPAFLIACLAAIFSMAHVLSPERIRSVRRVLWPLRLNLWQMMGAVAIAAFVILVFEMGYELAFALTLVSFFVLASFARAWCNEFVFLMGLRDDDLPGRNDKVIWALVLFTFAPITVWFFRSYRLAHWPEPEPVPQSQLHPETQGTTATQPA